VSESGCGGQGFQRGATRRESHELRVDTSEGKKPRLSRGVLGAYKRREFPPCLLYNANGFPSMRTEEGWAAELTRLEQAIWEQSGSGAGFKERTL
jgi:hypothetical protein